MKTKTHRTVSTLPANIIVGAMKNKTRLKILKLSCVYGGVLSLILVGLYVLLLVAFPRTVKFMPIQVVLLPVGIVSAIVFSYMHLRYASENPEEFTCPILPGIGITAICLAAGMIFIYPLLLCISQGDVFSVVSRFLYFIPGHISLILGILSAYAVLSGNRRPPEGIPQWKVRGLQLSTVILAAGIVISGISLSSGIIGDARMMYELTIDTSEETTLFVPLPVDESGNVAVELIDELEVIEGDAVWDIMDTNHGKALEVHTSTGCTLSAQQEYGEKGVDGGCKWVYSHNISMLSGVNRADYEAWIFASNDNTTLHLELSKDTGLGVVLSYRCDGTPLSKGWQTYSCDTTHLSRACVGQYNNKQRAPRPVDVDAVPAYNLPVTALSNTSADERSPAWSTDGRRIFFKSDDRICVCDPDGSHSEELAEIGRHPLIMDPEMKRVFHKNRTPDEGKVTYQAYVMDIDGNNQKKIAELTINDEYVDDGGYIGCTRTLAYDMHSWSPDRTEIFVTKLEETGYTWAWSEDTEKWERYRAGTEPAITVLDVEGWENQRLIAKEHLKTAWVWDLAKNELRFVGNVSYGIVHGTLGPVWSPDGEYVALSCSDLSESGATSQVFVINMETGESKRLTSFVGASMWPGWSCDNKKIIYVQTPPKYWWLPSIDNSDEGSDIWVVNIDGSNEKQLTDIPQNWEEGFGSPDGKKIVYASWKPGFMSVGETREIDVRMVNDDGDNERLLTTITTGFIVRMVWSPDGSKIAVVTTELRKSGSDNDIYIIHLQNEKMPKI